jgi:hypothetical protein
MSFATSASADTLRHPSPTRPTLLGRDISITLTMDRGNTHDITHALEWNGEDVVLDIEKVHEAITEHYVQGKGWGSL